MSVPLGKYELLRRLGEGGMGEVYLARDPSLGKLLVIKRMRAELSQDEQLLALFLDEARTAARLNHPNIVQLFELGEAEGAYYLAMELVHGQDLWSLIRRARDRGRPLPLGACCRIAADVGAALDFARRCPGPDGAPLELVHRDVTPHNVLLGYAGGVKLIDFGVSKAKGHLHRTATGVVRGKAAYMSPEQAAGERVDHRTDVFATGVVLWEMLTLERLFRGPTDADTLRRVAACEVEPPSAKNPAVCAELDALCLEALSRDQRRRIASAGELRDRLESIVLREGLAAGPSHLAAYLRELFAFEAAVPLEQLGSPVESTLRTPAAHPHGPHTQTLDAQTDPTSQPALESFTTFDRPRHNLPPQGDSFVGRVPELAQIHRMLLAGVRLLTLRGPGGAGKTRLLIEAATQLPARRGGIWFCDLSEATDVDGILAAASRALSLSLTAGKTTDDAVAQVGHALSSRGSIALLLDNFEHVVEHAPLSVGRWLAAAPKALFLVTSREPLGIAGEECLEVAPLQLPGPEDDVASTDAVRLFVERAMAAREGLSFGRAELLTAAEIVRQLDGLPLAIELAAARLSVLTLAQLLERLPRRLELLGAPGAPASRRSTLRATLEWSWSLIGPREQSALAQASVFRGGFDSQAAEAVLDLTRAEGEETATEALRSLVRRSLLRELLGGRFGFYESVRAFAQEKLGPSSAPVRERHARHFLALGQKLAERADGAEGKLALDSLSRERDNLLAVAQGERPVQALEALLALDPLLSTRGPFGSHLPWLDGALARAAGADPRLLAKGHEARGRARQARGRLAEAATDYRRALELSRAAKDTALEGREEAYLAGIERLTGAREAALERYLRAIELLEQAADGRVQGRALGNLGDLQQELGRLEDARENYSWALALLREAGDLRFEAIVRSNLGALQQALGELEAAAESYETALSIHKELGNVRSEGIGLSNLGDLMRDRGRPDAARALYERALAVHRLIGNRRWEAIALMNLGLTEHELLRLDEAIGHYRRAAGLFFEVGDRRFGAFVRGALGAALSGRGRREEGERLSSEAEATLKEVADAPMLAALDIYRGHVEIASGRMEAALERMRRAHGPGPSSASRSELVRTALRSLEAALRETPTQRL